MEQAFYTAYKQENPLYKSKPWAFNIKTHPESELGKKGIRSHVWGGYATKKAAQSAADTHKRIAEIKGII